MHKTIPEYLRTLDKALAAGNATEHTHRPTLKTLLEELNSEITATNEPKRIRCGAPDLVLSRRSAPIGYVETKDVGVPLDLEERGEQIGRYRESLANLVLTDYLEFRWYVGGERRLTARLGGLDANGRIKLEEGGAAAVLALLSAFMEADVRIVSSPRDLAVRMAGLARLIRDVLYRALKDEEPAGSLRAQLDSFRRVLLPELTDEQFADMYAQTICYGLFAARCNHDGRETFTRKTAAFDLPRTNPFLREVFAQMAGPDLDDRLVWVVDDLSEVLARADIRAILKDFGKHTRREDPVVHFYETFLAAYDPKLRETRGVYYTPEPVVSYIVSSVDHTLRESFGLKKGLADPAMVTASHGDSPDEESHKVIILDPATGTGTFLYGVIAQILTNFRGSKGMWSSYVREHLLPRLFGFELLTAPYAVAHMKLGLQLAETGYDFKGDERLGVYLTNTLEEAHASAGLPLFARWLAEEANAAAEIKQQKPVMVVLGNPPYSRHSENHSPWIRTLMKTYKEGCPELRKAGQAKGLSDDYVKFIRFAQWRIEQTGYGILAFITNHGYLDNPTFRGMRRSLMETFDDVYLLDLHGNKNKQEQAPDGSKDENVFDILQGVAIGIFVKRKPDKKKKLAVVRHADLWGPREEHSTGPRGREVIGGKYEWLWSNDVGSTKWKVLDPVDPAWLFVPRNTAGESHYEKGWSVRAVFSPNGDPAPGIVTTHDEFAISWSREEALAKVEQLLASRSEDEARSLFKLCTQDQWRYERAKSELKNRGWRERAIQVLYRPFDLRWTIYDRNVAVHRRERVMKHMVPGGNIGLVTSRLTKGEEFKHVQITRHATEVICMSPKTSNNGFLFPLYLREESEATLFDRGHHKTRLLPNLDPGFIAELSKRTGLGFISHGAGDLSRTFGPEDVLGYIVAILHSPEYRRRYGEFLKADFPRIPLTSKRKLFQGICQLGHRLIGLQLFEEEAPAPARFPKSGDNLVGKLRYAAEGVGKVWINDQQYFAGVTEELWAFEVGGYRVCEKWLKDRRGRTLDYADLEHYGRIVAALSATMKLMPQVDRLVDANGGWPLD